MTQKLSDLVKVTALMRDRELARLSAISRAQHRAEGAYETAVAAAHQALRDTPDFAAQAVFDRWLIVARRQAAHRAAEREALRLAVEAQRKQAARAFGRALAADTLAKRGSRSGGR